MTDSLRPADGYRLLIVFSSEDASGARYDVTVHLPTEDIAYRAHLKLPKGEVELEPVATPAPDALHAQVVAQLRTIARAKVKQLDQAWPRRLLRWRPDPKSE